MINLFTRLILYPVCVVLSLIFTLIALLFVNWWAPLFAYEDDISDGGITYRGYRLPWWLAWFDTFDADLDIGARTNGVEPSYWTRVQWLYRNSAYGFDYWAFGRVFDPIEWTVVTYVPVSESNKNPYFYAVGPNGAFNLRAVFFGIQFKIGWKAWNYFQQDTMTWKQLPWGPEMRVPFVFSFSLNR